MILPQVASKPKFDDTHAPHTKHFSITDANGKVILDKRYIGSQNGKGWLIMYRQTAAIIAAGELTQTATRLLMFFFAYCSWDSGYTTTRADLAKQLRISRPALNNAIKSLKTADLIREAKEHGATTFYLNPDFITQGRNRAKRIDFFKQLPTYTDSADKLQTSTAADRAATPLLPQ